MGDLIKFPPELPGEEKPKATFESEPLEPGPSMWDEILRKNEKKRRKVEYERKKDNEYVTRSYRLPTGGKPPDDIA